MKKQEKKELLFQKLKDANAFWSYEIPTLIDDDNLIEYVLIHLDSSDIEVLFQLYKKNHVHKVWRERLVKQEPFYHSLNVKIAALYFSIKDPESYIKKEAHKLYNF